MGYAMTAIALRHVCRGGALKVPRVTHTRAIFRHCATCATPIVGEGGGGVLPSRAYSTLSRAAHTRPAPSAGRGALASHCMRTT
jgi:hypothetical protein